MQPRNLSHSGAQGFIELEGSSAARVAVEWVAQPAGCSTTARAQEDGPVIWEALSVLQERQSSAGRLKRGEPELGTKPEGGNPHIRFRGGPRQGDRPGLLNIWINQFRFRLAKPRVARPHR
jgi:hypothetical protein